MGKKCGRCSTRYCGPECQVQHWKEGGHDKLCKKIKKAGGAEQYNADKKYAEAVAVAVAKCADDTKGQTCYICTQALHWKTKEGLVRGCACRGTSGVAHVSCLVEQAKILVAEAEENNLDAKAMTERFRRWETCSLCEQDYHGVVLCALGWACWKTYLGRPEGEEARIMAMSAVGNGLFKAFHFEDALLVQEAMLLMERRLGASEESILATQSNLANSYENTGRVESALQMKQDVYSGYLKHNGIQSTNTLIAATNYAACLGTLQRYGEAKVLMRKTMPVAQRVLGESNEITLRMRLSYGMALCQDPAATIDNLREAVTTHEEVARTARRVFGGAHPFVGVIERALPFSRALLHSRETPMGA